MKLKKLLIASLSILFIFIVAACSSDNSSDDSDEASGDGEKITLDFWLFGATGYEELVKEYEKQNENIKIKIKTSETADHHNNLFTALSAGSGAPDIAALELDQLDRFRDAQDRFVNLYDMGADDVKGEYLDWKWEIAENDDGKFLMGLPTDIGPKGLYYRLDVFEEAGLPTTPEEVSALIATPEDFKEAAIQIKEKTGKPMVASMEMMYRAQLDALEESYFDKEGNLLIEESGNGVKEAYDLAIEMNELGLVGNYAMWSAEWASGVDNGDFAVELGAAWFKGWMESNAPEATGEFNIATLPTEYSGNWGGSYISIPKETKHAEEAYEFVKWLVSPENQLESFKSNGLFPSAPAVYDMAEFKEASDDYFGGQSTQTVFAESAQKIGKVYKGKDYTSVHDEILAALVNSQDGADAEKEWTEAIKRIKTKLDR
ncbi:extracellular solute-binding protein [Psychrobacillus psychrodurans]|uniref:ABC transporter substrate-binding protein n=1 Tax=Psychrobacillus psychrodurans TaxID=126157 RepID=UPI001F4E2B5A|nr:extracellular solute-binding protein [Psychrobacillus psychrodurans]MCK1998531.1 extracellular solute-binding protein [Psychrobacillus psychrodurans]